MAWLVRSLWWTFLRLAAGIGVAACVLLIVIDVRSRFAADLGSIQYVIAPDSEEYVWRMGKLDIHATAGVIRASVAAAQVGYEGLVCFPPPPGLDVEWETSAPVDIASPASSAQGMALARWAAERGFCVRRGYWSVGRDFEAGLTVMTPIWLLWLASLAPAALLAFTRHRKRRQRGFAVLP